MYALTNADGVAAAAVPPGRARGVSVAFDQASTQLRAALKSWQLARANEPVFGAALTADIQVPRRPPPVEREPHRASSRNEEAQIHSTLSASF